MTASVIQVRVDSALRKEADELFSGLGLSTQTAIKIFLNRSLERGGLPFDVAHDLPYHLLNDETHEALDEGRRLAADPIKNGYTVDEFSALMDTL